MMDTAVMVTGHRELTHRDVVFERCCAVLERLDPDLVLSGGAEGADSVFAEAAVRVGVPLVLLFPNRHYRSQYPAAASDTLVAAAVDVRFAVDRPECTDWAERWRAERWWVDNFVRNAALVDASTDAVVISPLRPLELIATSQSGTADAVKSLASARPDRKVIWVPDDETAPTRWAPVTRTHQLALDL